MYEWHEVKSKKDMPHKSGDIIILSAMGCINIAFWNASKRELWVYALRNYYDKDTQARVFGDRIDLYGLKPWKKACGMCFAWCEIPATPKEWEA